MATNALSLRLGLAAEAFRYGRHNDCLEHSLDAWSDITYQALGLSIRVRFHDAAEARVTRHPRRVRRSDLSP